MIQGRVVVVADSLAVGGATVQLLAGERRATLTATDGTFQLRSPTARPDTLLVRHSAFLPLRADLLIPDDSVIALDVRLERLIVVVDPCTGFGTPTRR